MSTKLQDTIEAFQKGRMTRREFFARGAAFGVSTGVLGYMLNRSVSQALAADFDWKKHDGTAIKLLLNKHPYTDAMIANLDNFKEMTGM
ncbi:MAG: ABC transporter substrate-binding protein, partial [Geminicoccaceae bacterium]